MINMIRNDAKEEDNMSNLHRLNILKHQDRSFTEGTVINDDEAWIFVEMEIDDEGECDLDFYTQSEAEVFRENRWIKGILIGDGTLQTSFDQIHLLNGETLRIKKSILFSFEKLLEELKEDVFIQFITTLNSNGYSIYDCIYCHNHLAFLDNQKVKQGVNFIAFDNGDQVCMVQHHFTYYKKNRDRFEFTLSTGKRVIIENLFS